MGVAPVVMWVGRLGSPRAPVACAGREDKSVCKYYINGAMLMICFVVSILQSVYVLNLVMVD